MKNQFAAFVLFASFVFQVSCATPPVNQIPMPSPTSVPTNAPMPTTIPNADAAIALVQSQVAEVSKIQKARTGGIGRTQDITVFERADGWDIAFWQGEGDCPAGCINNHYWYFSVKKDGRISKAGEYVRVYNASANKFDISGVPMWDVPK